MQPYIVNIVVKYHLLGEIDTSNLNKEKNFSGYTVKKGNRTARVYENGVCIVTGVKSVSEGDTFVRENFPNNPLITRNVINMTASGKLPYGVCPFKLLKWHKENKDKSPFTYESEIFPAIYWKGQPETVYFFPSGSVIITGLKTLNRLDPVWESLVEDIDKAMCLPNSAI